MPEWKHELNERLQATRGRRGQKEREQSSVTALDSYSKSESRAARLAAKVAERYKNAPSYSEILAEEARAAAAAAEAAAEAATEAARHASLAAQALLADLEAPVGEPSASGMSGRLETVERQIAEEGNPPHANRSGREQREQENHGRASAGRTPGRPTGFLPEDSFQDASLLAAQPLPVNLIEFPRELVAARKARPRLAEGPLREDSQDADRDHSPLRIFEAEAADIAKSGLVDAVAPEWSSIRLDATPSSIQPNEEALSRMEVPVKAAALEDRLMAAIVDFALVLFAFLAFVLVFAACTAHLPSGKAALAAGAIVLGGLFLLYQYLFFKFTEGTPGMRYAKIALCTFEDENPSRKAMRRRILFLLLSAAPLGMGFLWAFFDTDRLGWHDRLTRIYQRSYR